MKQAPSRLFLSIGLGAVMVIAGCDTNGAHSTNAPAGGDAMTAPKTSTSKSDQQAPHTIASKDKQPKSPSLNLSNDWPTFGGNLWQDRVSPMSFSPTGERWQPLYNVPVSSGGSSETYPLEQGGTLYVTTMQGEVMAIAAATGKRRWTYVPKLSLDQGIPTINRGVALGEGDVFVLTADDRLIALSEQTGRLRYQVTVANESLGYFESMAPLYADGKVFVGSAGGDEGVRGFESCYQAATGKLLWKTYTIPPRGQGWLPKSGDHGGGAVWNVPAFNARTNRLFFGTGNPSPDFFGEGRSGPDPMTDAIVNVNASTGKVVWYRQEVAHDLWDYDVASPPMLFTVRGKLAVGEAGKDGEWYEWYVKTGKQVFAPVAFVKEDHVPPTSTPTLEWPGSEGGANYGPSAYDSKDGSVIVSGINGPEYVQAEPTEHSSYRVDDGTSSEPAPAGDWTGTLTRIDAATGKVAWHKKLATPAIGGVTATMGGTAFFGEANGWLYGVDMTTGKTVWSYHAGIPVASAPIVYRVGQQTYLTFALGQCASLQGLFPYSGQTRILTFRLMKRK